MFLAALILASKYLQDRNFSAKAWSKMSGLKVCEINLNEMAFLRTVDWKLHIPGKLFQRWTEIVLRSGSYGPFADASNDAIIFFRDSSRENHKLSSKAAFDVLCDGTGELYRNGFSTQLFRAILAFKLLARVYVFRQVSSVLTCFFNFFYLDVFDRRAESDLSGKTGDTSKHSSTVPY
ncbi:hypothetical protein LTR28_000651 [Elasticomyces elasticus]|nr:hypothetical protein LTR28_000651 [Elasticomyces elasticus]